MVLSDLQKGLSSFSEELSSQTYLNTYRVQKRDSLLAEGLGTRANSIWKMAQYIIATYDGRETEPMESYLKGWGVLVKNYKNQFLFIETSEHKWQMYDSYSHLLGEDEYIANYIKAHQIRSADATYSHQLIYYGAPGTGKSFEINKTTEKIDKITEEKGDEPRVFRTTFHPDSDYSTFVGAYKPTMKPAVPEKGILDYNALVQKFKDYLDVDKNITRACTKFGFDYYDSIVRAQQDNAHSIPVLVADAYKAGTTYDTQVRSGMSVYETSYKETDKEEKIIYRFVAQSFTKAYIRAWKTTDPVILVIEEINRGNCAQIFGDLFQLLDRDENNESKYPIDPDSDLGNYIADELRGYDIPEAVRLGKKMKLPSNLYIWATMNTSDQSLFPMDSAFKRRWEWRYIKILEGKDEKGKAYGWKLKYGKDGNESEQDWWEFLQHINMIIASMTSSADKQLGYFFCKPDKDNTISSKCFVNKVVFYLWNDVFKNYAMDEGKLFKFIPKDTQGKNMEERDLTYSDFYSDIDGKEQDYVIAQFIQHVMEWNTDNKK